MLGLDKAPEAAKHHRNHLRAVIVLLGCAILWYQLGPLSIGSPNHKSAVGDFAGTAVVHRNLLPRNLWGTKIVPKGQHYHLFEISEIHITLFFKKIFLFKRDSTQTSTNIYLYYLHPWT